MNDFLQTPRADPVPSSEQAYKPARRKDLPPATNFAAVLDTQYKKEKPKAAEESKPASDERDRDDKPAETASDATAQAAPIGGTPTPPAQPVQPPPDGGSKDQPAQAGPGAAAGAVAALVTEGSTGASAAALAGAIQAAAAKTMGAVAQKADPKAAQGPAPDAGAAKTGAKDTLQLSAAQDGAAAIPAPNAQAAAQAPNAPKHASLEDLQVPVPAQQPAAARGKAAEALNAAKVTVEPNVAPPGAAQASHAQPAAIDPTSIRVAQPALDGVHLTTAANSVFEPARLTEAQTNNLIWQVSSNVEALARSRQSSLHLMLNPEELGRIDLRLTSTSAGTGVSIIAQQSGTSQLLESQVAQLRQALAQAGIHLTNLSVGQQNSQASTGQPGQRQRGQASARQSVSGVEAVAEDRMAFASLSPSEGYDFRA